MRQTRVRPRLTLVCFRTLYDLMVMDDAGREEAVNAVRTPRLQLHFPRVSRALHHAQLGLTAAQRKDFDGFVGAVPCVSLDAICETEVCSGWLARLDCKAG